MINGQASTPELEIARRGKIAATLTGRNIPGRGWKRGRKRGPQSPEHRARIGAANRVAAARRRAAQAATNGHH